LGLVQIEETPEEERPHLRDRRPDRVAVLAEDVPEKDGRGGGAPVSEIQRRDSLGDLRIVTGRLTEASQITLDIGEEDEDAKGAEVLGDGVDRDRLAVPVPVAPVTRPWRFVMASRSAWACAPIAMVIGSAGSVTICLFPRSVTAPSPWPIAVRTPILADHVSSQPRTW